MTKHFMLNMFKIVIITSELCALLHPITIENLTYNNNNNNN